MRPRSRACTRWLHAAGARWGLDAAHRARLDAPRDDAYTWAFALDRLLLGHASGSDDDHRRRSRRCRSSKAARWMRSTRWCGLLRVLARHAALLGEAMTPDAMARAPARPARRAAAAAAVGARRRSARWTACAADRRLRRRRAARRLRRAGAGRSGARAFRRRARRGRYARAAAHRRRQLRPHGADAAAAVPRDLPARHERWRVPAPRSCRRPQPAHRRTRQRPAPRTATVPCATTTASCSCSCSRPRQDVFYVSYQGADPRDGSAREPSVLVVRTARRRPTRSTRPRPRRGEQLVVHHPLQPFAPAAFGAGDDRAGDEPRRFCYRQQWWPAAGAARATAHRAAAVVRRRCRCRRCDGREADARCRSTRCAASCRRPPKPSCANGSACAWPRWTTPTTTSNRCSRPVAAWTLASAAAGGVRGPAARRGRRGRCMRLLRARALLPSGPLGRRHAGAVARARSPPYAQALRAWRGDARGGSAARSRSRSTACACTAASTTCIRTASRASASTSRMARVDPPRPGLAAGARGRRRHRPLVAVPRRRANRRRSACTRSADAAKRARCLRAPDASCAQGLRAPLPFAPYSGWETVQRADAGEARRRQQAAANAWRGSERSWAEGDTASAAAGAARTRSVRRRSDAGRVRGPGDDDLRAVVRHRVRRHRSRRAARDGRRRIERGGRGMMPPRDPYLDVAARRRAR